MFMHLWTVTQHTRIRSCDSITLCMPLIPKVRFLQTQTQKPFHCGSQLLLRSWHLLSPPSTQIHKVLLVHVCYFLVDDEQSTANLVRYWLKHHSRTLFDILQKLVAWGSLSAADSIPSHNPRHLSVQSQPSFEGDRRTDMQTRVQTHETQRRQMWFVSGN